MSQHDMNVADSSFPTFRADMNNAFQALVTNNSGPTAPATPYPNQFWYDTTSSQFKIRNSDNDAWVTVAYFDEENGRFNMASIDPTTLATLATVDLPNDLLLVWDDSASASKKMPLQTLANTLQTGLPQNVRNFIPQVNVTDPEHDLDFYRPNTNEPAYFVATDGAGQLVSKKWEGTTITKQIDATWASGDNEGGLAIGTPGANTALYAFALFKSNGTGMDIGFDPDPNATNLMANAAVEAAEYDLYRKVGSVMTDASANIIPGSWREIEGGALEFRFDSPVMELQKNDTSTQPTVGLTSLDIAAPAKVWPLLSLRSKTNTSAHGLRWYLIDNNNDCEFYFHGNSEYTGSYTVSYALYIQTDENGEISYRIEFEGAYNGWWYFENHGWKEVR